MDVSSFILQSGAVSALSITLSRSKITTPARNKASGLVKELLNCPYCISHWLALGGALDTVHPLRLTNCDAFVVYWFGLVAASALITGAIMRLFLSQETRIAELEADLDKATDLLRDINRGVSRR